LVTHLPHTLHGASVQTRTDALLQWLRSAADADYIGEGVSQLHHALQCATLAKGQTDTELVLAALLHDIGHSGPSDETSMEGLGTYNHERVGADLLLGLGFSPRLARLVAGHVEAKRYLASTKAGYLNRLSPASARTLDLQGGPMSAEEAERFRRHPDFRALVQLRSWDEGAKDVDLTDTGGLEPFLPAIKSHLAAQDATEVLESLRKPINAAQRTAWEREHVLTLPGLFTGSALQALMRWTDDLAHRPETPGRWMKYFERAVDDDRLLCRVEDFVPFHAGFDALLRGPVLLERLGELMGEPAVLFKEKINFKLPGGSGFAAHQDAPAFGSFGQRYHITVLITLDRSDRSNGGLEFANPVPVYQTLPQNADGTVADTLTEQLNWRALDLPPGSLVFFDSYIPHRSATNDSVRPRRSLYVTYNRAAEGDRRTDYYADKRRSFPPEIERVAGVDYAAQAGPYNLANPIR
jgi:predicted HD phosphohydrolase